MFFFFCIFLQWLQEAEAVEELEEATFSKKGDNFPVQSFITFVIFSFEIV